MERMTSEPAMGLTDGELAQRERACEKERLKERIANAFRGVVLGNGVGLLQGQALDDWADKEVAAEQRKSDETRDWRRITRRQLVDCQSSLSFFDAEGMRFHLPAFMIAELHDDRDCDFGLGFRLAHQASEDRHGLLNQPQREAVSAFLQYMLNDPKYEFGRDDLHTALAGYWAS